MRNRLVVGTRVALKSTLGGLDLNGLTGAIAGYDGGYTIVKIDGRLGVLHSRLLIEGTYYEKGNNLYKFIDLDDFESTDTRFV